MYAAWSVGLAQPCFVHLDYLVVQHWICITYLFPDTVKQMGSQIYHYVKFFLGRVVYMSLGTPFDCIVDIIDHSNTVMPLVVTAFLALRAALTNHCHYVAKCQVLIQHT